MIETGGIEANGEIEVARAAQITSAATAIADRTITTIKGKTMVKTAKQQVKRPRHVPMRTCVACKQSKPKRELLRVVRTPDEHVLMDATGRRSCRGAYLCARLSCWQDALKKKRLEQEFELTLSDEDRAGLEAFIATLPTD